MTNSRSAQTDGSRTFGGDDSLLWCPVTAAEVEQAPSGIRQIHDQLIAMAPKSARSHRKLVDNDQKRKVLSRRFRSDMLHIALATVAEADILVSWNFRHIVRFDKIGLFNSVNQELGYKQLSIYSPREMASHETERPRRLANIPAVEVIDFFNRAAERAAKRARRLRLTSAECPTTGSS